MDVLATIRELARIIGFDHDRTRDVGLGTRPTNQICCAFPHKSCTSNAADNKEIPAPSTNKASVLKRLCDDWAAPLTLAGYLQAPLVGLCLSAPANLTCWSKQQSE